MPEGPEIRLAAERVARVLEGRKIERAWFAFDRLKPWGRRLRGRSVHEVQPRGKALLVRFEGEVNLYSHNQLYGRWYVRKAGETPRTGRQLRVELRTAESSAMLYSASEIEVLRDTELASHPYLGRLGPDVLDPAVKPSDVLRRMEQQTFRRRGLGGLLLDQGFLGGVGNYLRSEILFVAGIDPSRRPADLEPSEKNAFARAALSVSRRAYRTRGITNDPAIVRRLREAGLPRRAYRHFVFGRDGAACHRCSAEVRKLRIAGRRL
jgi:endonuclease-8